MKDLRKIDDLGRLVLPAEMRKTLGWDERESISIELDETQCALILKQGSPYCCCGGAEQGLYQLLNRKLICQSCLSQAKPFVWGL